MTFLELLAVAHANAARAQPGMRHVRAVEV